MIEVEYADYRVATNEYWGWCTTCNDFAGNAEPDARKYKCPDCGKKTLMGIEEAMLEGLLRVLDFPE